jgi:hypothetical protein
MIEEIGRTPNGWLAEYAEALEVPKKRLLVLAANNDPFNVGTEAQIEQAKWFKGVHDRVGYRGIHLRRLHYRAYDAGVLTLDGEPYPNTEKQWEALQNASRFARYLGYVNPEDFTDNRSPNPILSVSGLPYARLSSDTVRPPKQS